MRDIPASQDTTDWVSEIEAWPVHSARRSFTNFKRHLLDQLTRLPQLTFHESGLMFHSQHVEVEPKAFFHYAAASAERFQEGLDTRWSTYLDLLKQEGLTEIESWAGARADAQALERQGFVLGDEMAWLRFSGPTPQPLDARIRPYRPGDIDRILAIHHLTSEEEWRLSRPAYEDWLNSVATRVLEIDDKIAGFTHLRQIETSGLFEGLAVHPAYQRRRLATALVQDSFTWFATRGAETIDLFVLESNEAGLKLYDGLGFTRMGQQIRCSLIL